MKVGVVGNPSYGDLTEVLGSIARAAPRLGLTLCSEAPLRPLWPAPPPDTLDFTTPLDCLLTLGGDGTLLRAARALNGADTPILGINLGRLGFLTTTAAQEVARALAALVQGDYVTESRSTLASTLEDGAAAPRPAPTVLNDVVVHKGGVARVVRMRVAVDGDDVGQYSADGIIVSTPTGSTAYSLSAGGPIVVPTVDAMVVTAISPHTLAVRPLVVPATAVVTLEPIPPWTDEVLVSFDGQRGTTMQPGERLVVRRGAHAVKLVRLGDESFFARIRKKLHWGDLSGRVRT
jgi:NAD+ kinase